MSDDARVEVLIDDAVYTESPRWHDGGLWFSDIGAGQVRRIVPTGDASIVISGMNTPSGLGWMSTGDLLVTSIEDGAIYRVGPDGAPQIFCDFDRHGVPGTNDMATAGGRSYVTCSGFVYTKGLSMEVMSQPHGKILLLDHQTGGCRIVAEEMRMPNGVAITPDGRTLIVAEVFAQRILKFDIATDGSLSNPRAFVQLDHIVDGLALDAEGGVWVGAPNGFKCIGADGDQTDFIPVPGWSCIAPMLGGPDGRTLFMAVSQMEEPDAIFDGRARGRILTARVATPAAPEWTRNS
jgi:sugar lactone lactonase YvrE